MNKFWGLLVFVVLAAGLACEKNEGKPGAATTPVATESARGPNERFYTIQQKLDSGGTFYMYADLKDVLHNFMNQLQTTYAGPQTPPEMAKACMMANQVIDRLGLYGIHDLGMSVVPDGALKRSKLFISDADGRKKGLLSLLGGAPHSFPMLDRVSSDTLLLATGDLDTSTTWALVRQIAQDLGGKVALAQMDNALRHIAQQSGINVPAILPTLGGEFTLVMTQDPASKLVIPAVQPIVVDSPRLALMVRVKDDTLYQALKALLMQKAHAPETTDGKLRKVMIPAPPNPIWAVSPVIATDGSYVYFSTHDEYLRRLTAAPAAAGSLRQAAEFKQLGQGLPTEGNGLFFVSSKLKNQVTQVVEKVVQMNQGRPGQNPVAFMHMFSQLKGAGAGTIMVRVNQPDGLLMVGRSDSSALQLAPAIAMVPVAVLAAIAVPNFLEAQTRAKVSRARSDMRSLQIALESYNVDQNRYPPTLTPCLTTPITYITSVPKDPFSPQDNPIQYELNGKVWKLWSVGPDHQDDHAALAFDPTNGTNSRGDIIHLMKP